MVSSTSISVAFSISLIFVKLSSTFWLIRINSHTNCQRFWFLAQVLKFRQIWSLYNTCNDSFTSLIGVDKNHQSLFHSRLFEFFPFVPHDCCVCLKDDEYMAMQDLVKRQLISKKFMILKIFLKKRKWAKPSLFLVIFIIFTWQYIALIWIWIIKAYMVCLGLEPGAAGW